MALDKVSEYSCSCFVCHKIFVFHGYYMRDALQSAKEDGWIIGEKDYCPECRVK